MSFPWSFSVLGYVGGVVITLGMAIIVLYTSYICWQFCMAYGPLGIYLIIVTRKSEMSVTLAESFLVVQKLRTN
jgi:hypothetical protein